MYRIIKSHTESYRVIQIHREFYRVIKSHKESYRVLQSHLINILSYSKLFRSPEVFQVIPSYSDYQKTSRKPLNTPASSHMAFRINHVQRKYANSPITLLSPLLSANLAIVIHKMHDSTINFHLCVQNIEQMKI